MDKNFENQNSNENFLSQSYFDSIQKVTGNDKASLLDFQIPAVLLEKRKNAWNALFEKYSSNVCQEQDEMESREQENEEECTTKNDKRFPMRKPMSMVQYWVNTGNQPYITNNLEKSQSDSGSSLVEECLETVESVNLPCQMINISLEKDHQTDESSSNIYLKLPVDQNEDIEKSLPISIIENKTFRRKKLYNNSESPAEFTPASEDNISRPSFKKPIKQCQHPALETPRIASRPSYLVRQQRLKSRTKRKNRISHSIRILHFQKNGKNNNSQNVLQDNSQTINVLEENCDKNLQKAIDCSQKTKLQEHCERKSNLTKKNLLNNSKKTLFNLRPLVVSLKRLPYKYDSMEINSLQEKQLDSLNSNKNDDKIIYSQNSSQSLSIEKKSHALQVKSDKLKNLTNGVSPNLTNNNESDSDCKSSATDTHAFSSQIRNSHSKKSTNYIIVFSSDDESELSISNLRQNSPKLPKETSHIKNSFNVNDCSEKQLGLNSKIDNPNKKSKKSVSNKIKNEKEKHNLKSRSNEVTKLEQSEKIKMTSDSCKSLLLENNNKSDSKFFSLSKQMNKKVTVMSSNEETATGEPTDCSVPNKFLEESKRNISSSSKSLKENYDQTSSNVLSLNERRHFSSKEKKTKASETKSKLLKRSIAVKKVRYSGNTSSDEDAYLPLKYDFKSKLVTCAVKDNVLKSISATEETTNLIGDLSANSVLLKKNENKVNHLAERINKIKMKNQSTLLNSNNDNLKTVKELLPRIDSSEEENYLEDKSSAKKILKKTTDSKNKRVFKEHFEMSNDKSRNKGKEKSTKPYLSSKKAKRKSEMFMSSDEECIIPLKIKLT